MKNAKEIYLYAFALLFVIGFFYLAIALKNTPESGFVTGIIETVKNGVILILGYFFGSSKGSADKTEIMNKEINEPK
jgi:hypothetical protein